VRGAADVERRLAAEAVVTANLQQLGVARDYRQRRP
jgi:hypothetical protein